jgi:hypothetical protein
MKKAITHCPPSITEIELLELEVYMEERGVKGGTRTEKSNSSMIRRLGRLFFG